MYLCNSSVLLPVKRTASERFLYLFTAQRKALILFNLCTDAGYRQISLAMVRSAGLWLDQLAQGELCAMELRAGEDGETSSALASASVTLFSALELYQFTLRALPSNPPVLGFAGKTASW